MAVKIEEKIKNWLKCHEKPGIYPVLIEKINLSVFTLQAHEHYKSLRLSSKIIRAKARTIDNKVPLTLTVYEKIDI